MDADLERGHQFNPMVGGGGGLTRYKSAPSSYFSNFVMEYKDVSDFLRPPPPKPLSPQIDRIFAQLASELSGDATTPAMKPEIEPEPSRAYTPSAALPPPHPLSRTSSGVDRMLKSSAPAQVMIPVVEIQSSGNNLARHNSLPSGLFSQIDVHNVAAAYFGASGNIQANTSSELMPTYSSGMVSDDAKQSSNASEDVDYMLAGFWNDSSPTEKLLTGVKRERDEDDFLADDVKPFSAESNTPAGEAKKTGVLSHHLSMPKSSMEILSAMEKFLELQDSTAPVGVRAKRGCATHPRSIAERVRRTKISDRMRILQELVPNMDKQTNTSDMLDLAVDYIKDLQQRVQMLKAWSDSCTC